MATQESISYVYPIIKPVGSLCNLACAYCYYRDRKLGHQLMTTETCDNLIRNLLLYNSSYAPFLWHGGEPLLAGLDFYQRAVDLQNKYRTGSHRIKNLIQTNATLIDEPWVKFFKENDFGVGTSLDGPREIHEHFRPGSFDCILRSIQLMKDSGVGTGIICVVNSYNSLFPSEVYSFLRDIGSGMVSIKPCIEMATSGNDLSEFSVDPVKYAEFMIKIFDLWFSEDNPKFMIREFENIILGVLGAKPVLCAFRVSGCQRYITVNLDGAVYSCDSFVGDDYRDFIYGNVNIDSFSELINSSAALKLLEVQREAKIQCLTCEYLALCGGGCNNFQIHLNQEYRQKYCAGRKLLIQYVRERVLATRSKGGLYERQ